MITLKEIKKNKGATLDNNFNNIELKKGYQVSIEDLEIVKVYKLTKKHLMTLLNKNKNLGIWIEKNNAYIDYSITINTKKEALKIGKQLNQISIFDWKNKKVVYC